MARAADFDKRTRAAYNTLQEFSIDLESFSRLRVTENAAGPMRVSALKEEVEKLESRERSLQSLYAELAKEKSDAEERVAALEERAMMEAEALNEAALAEMES